MIFDKKNLNKDGEIDKKHTIMVVDDHKGHLNATVSLLSDTYEVIPCSSGREALECIQSVDKPEKISLIISDQRMPDLTGLQFFKAIKDIIPNTIRFILTGFADIAVIIEAINDVNVHQFIMKDFEPEDLLQRVEFALKYFDQQQELGGYHRRLEEMVTERTQALKKSISIKDIFLSMFTHDLGNQIGRLTYVANKIYQMRDAIDAIYEEQDNTSRLTNDLRRWAQATKGEIKPRPEKIDVHLLAKMNIELLERKAKSKKITLSSEVEPETTAFADKNMVLSIIRNLLSNAVNFTKKNGWVKIGAVAKGEFIEVSVCDNGIGMSEEQIDNLFREDLMNSREGTDKEEGTGMGLIICKEFVEMNNGSISVDSEVGKGSCFKFTLPVREWEVKA